MLSARYDGAKLQAVRAASLPEQPGREIAHPTLFDPSKTLRISSHSILHSRRICHLIPIETQSSWVVCIQSKLQL